MLADRLAGVSRRRGNLGKPRYVDVAEAYLLHIRKQGTRATYVQAARRWRPYLDDLLLVEVTEEVVQRFVAAHRPRLSDPTIRLNLEYLSAVLRFGGVPKPNAVHRYNKRDLKTARKVRRWLTYEEERALLACAPSALESDLLVFAVETGMRAGEEFALTWKRVDLRQGHVDLSEGQTKSEEPRLIPLTERALGVLTRRPRHPTSDIVFWRPDGSAHLTAGNWWWRWRKKANLGERIRWHDLRHTFARRFLVDGKGDIATLSKLLGHSKIDMTMRYLAWATADLHAKVREAEAIRLRLREARES